MGAGGGDEIAGGAVAGGVGAGVALLSQQRGHLGRRIDI